MDPSAPLDSDRRALPQARSVFWEERLMLIVLGLAASVPVAIVIALLVVFAHQAWQFFAEVSLWDFLTDTQWTPNFKSQNVGIAVIAVATLLIATIACLVALPVGLLAAIYLREYAPRQVRRVLKPTLEALAGVPTIVYGYFALRFVTPFLDRFVSLAPFNALSAGLVTGVLIVPVISSISEDALDNVPEQLRQGAYALGFTQRETILRVVLPVAFPGIIAAFTLAASRAFGETTISAIAAGQSPNLTLNPFVPIESMTAFIFQVSLGDVPTDSFIFHAIFTVGAVLFLITLSLNIFGHWMVRRHSRTMAGLDIPMLDSPNAREEGTKRQSAIAIVPLADPSSFNLAFRWRKSVDRLFEGLALLGSLLGIVVFGLLLFSILSNGLSQLDWQFLTNFASRKPEESGIFAALMGSAWLLVITAVFAFPIGIGAAIFLEEYVPTSFFSRLLEIKLTNLAAVPSILYGLLGLALFARGLQPITGGRSILSAGLVLAAIVLPLTIVSTRTSLRAVPSSQRQAGYAVGMTRLQVIRHIVLPKAFAGIATGLLLSLSRAIGATAPLIAVGAVAFVSFVPSFSIEGLQSDFTTLPTQIYYWVARPQEEFRAIAAAAIIVLGAIVLLINIIAVGLRDAYKK